MFYKISALKIVAKFTGKHLRQSFFLNFAIILRTPFFTEQLWWLLLVIAVCQVHYKNPVMQFCKRIHGFLQQYPCCKLCNFVKKRLQHSCFLVNIAKFLRTPILKNFCERLLLKILMFFYKAFSPN